MSSLSRTDVRRRRAPRAAWAGPPAKRTLSRGLLFALLAVGCVAIGVAYVAWTVVRPGSAPRTGLSGPIATVGDAPSVSRISGGPGVGAAVTGAEEAAEAAVALVAGGPGTLLVQSLAGGEHWGRVGLVPLGEPEGPRIMESLGCMRVHFAADRGLCLAEDGGTISLDEDIFSTHAAYIFDPDFRVRHTIALNGYPSRARVSPDGRYGATTTFVAGHSYAEAGFSTETTIINLASGATLGNLEEFDVSRDGNPFESVDFNFWGVTFAPDSNRFYATLGTGGGTYLVEGDVGARQMRVLRENVECPSLSPDGTRLAFKKQVGGAFGGVNWRFHVLDLATMEETPLADMRSIDDQIEWLDDDRVLYGDGSHLWVMAADGSGQPERFMSMAASPAVVRTASLPSAESEPLPAESLALPSIDLAVAVSAAPEPAVVGEDLTYTLTVTNRGQTEATGLKVEQFLPEGLNFGEVRTVSLSSGGYGCSSAYPEERWVTCDTAVLPGGATWTIALTVKPALAGPIEHRATVSAMEHDSHPENDSMTTAIVATAGK